MRRDRKEVTTKHLLWKLVFELLFKNAVLEFLLISFLKREES